jgi:hypothetical protein
MPQSQDKKLHVMNVTLGCTGKGGQQGRNFKVRIPWRANARRERMVTDRTEATRRADTMSSTLAMILSVGMGVPGKGPEKVSGKRAQGLHPRRSRNGAITSRKIGMVRYG